MDVIDRGDYEEWVLGRGEQRRVRVGSGETFQNVLVDQTADDAGLNITASGSGWTVRNVGFRGMSPVLDHSWGGFHLVGSGHGTFQNIFIDNRHPNKRTAMGGGILPESHGGVVEVRNTFIAGNGNNAFYGSNPADEGGNAGSVEFYDCYHRDNTVSQYRVGHDCVIENCVGIVNDPNGTRGHYTTGPGDFRARGIWSRSMEGNVARNSVMYVSPNDVEPFANYFVQCYHESQGPRAVLTLDDCYANQDAPQIECVNCTNSSCPAELRGDPIVTDEVPNPLQEGVPTTPEMAARGQRHVPDIPELSGGGTPPPENGNGGTETTSLSITNDGADRTEYTFRIGGDGQIERTEGFGTGDQVSEDRTEATGFVRGGVDVIHYTGCVSFFDWSGVQPTLHRDGEVIPLDGVVDCEETPPPPPPEQAGLGVLGLGLLGAAAYEMIRRS